MEKITVQDFAFSNIIRGKDRHNFLGKEFKVFGADNTYRTMIAEDIMPDATLNAAVLFKCAESDIRIVGLMMVNGVGILLLKNLSFMTEAKNYLNEYSGFCKQFIAQNGSDKVDGFTTGMEIHVSSELVKSIKPIFERIDSKIDAVKSLFGDSSKKAAEKAKVLKEEGAIRITKGDEKTSIAIDAKFLVKGVEFLELYINEVSRIAIGIFSILNLKGMEKMFESKIKELNDRDNELK